MFCNKGLQSRLESFSAAAPNNRRPQVHRRRLSQDIDAAVTIGGEPFHLVAISGPLSSESAAWRYRTGVNDYLSSYPKLGGGHWLSDRETEFPCNIGGTAWDGRWETLA